MRSIVGVFEQISDVEQVVDELVRAGYNRDCISVVAQQEDACSPSVGPLPALSATGSVGSAAAVGGLGAFTAAMVALAVPGIGPILAAGPIAAELVAGGIGTIAGGLIWWLRQQGVPDSDADVYCEAVRRGGILLAVEAAEDEVEKAVSIIGDRRVIDMDAATLEWHRSGASPPAAEKSEQRAAAPVGLPFDPDSLKHSVREQRAARRAVRSYVRIS